MGRPYGPAQTYRRYSYEDFLEKARDEFPFFWRSGPWDLTGCYSGAIRATRAVLRRRAAPKRSQNGVEEIIASDTRA